MEDKISVKVLSGWQSIKKNCCGITYLLAGIQDAENRKGLEILECFYENTTIPFEKLKADDLDKKIFSALVSWKESKFDSSKADKYIVGLADDKGEIIWSL